MNQIFPSRLVKSQFQKPLDNNRVQCLTCERRCKISPNNLGHCRTRVNRNGTLYTMVWGYIPALSFNPIEKKPLFHFFPGSIAVTIGTYGCNFDCFWCQNSHLSHPRRSIPELINDYSQLLNPKELIRIALNNNCQGTSISFNEPTILFEYSLEVFKLAKENGFYNTYVSNGYMTEEVLKELRASGLDAINMDIKGDAQMVKKYCGADVEKVWKNAKIAKELGIHVEITTLVIEDLNSNEEIIESIASRIYRDLGEYTPFHLTRFFPHYKSMAYGFKEPTAVEVLQKLYNVAIKSGLKHVYLGNMPDTSHEHTYCPNCSKLLIKRKVFGVVEIFIDSEGKCKHCGFQTNVILSKNYPTY